MPLPNNDFIKRWLKLSPVYYTNHALNFLIPALCVFIKRVYDQPNSTEEENPEENPYSRARSIDEAKKSEDGEERRWQSAPMQDISKFAFDRQNLETYIL